MQILIIGAGKLGYKLAEAFSNKDNDIIVIDNNDQALARVNINLDVLTVKGSGAQTDILAQANVKKTDLAIAATDSDELNMVISVIAKRLGAKRTVARVRDPEYLKQLDVLKDEMNIDFIVNPEMETAKTIAKHLVRDDVVHVETFAHGKVGMIECSVRNLPEVAGQKLKELNVFRPLLIAAISRGGSILIPHGETTLESSDILYLFGKRPDLSEFSRSYAGVEQPRTIRNVCILGGGKVGFYLAGKLLQNGVQVKIIERDEQRCQYLAENLSNALIIHGDATDVDLLREEDIANVDALVLVTGQDEENLLLALLCKQSGVSRVVAKVSRSNYIPIIEQLGIDIAVNPVLISTSEIIRFAQGGQLTSISLLLNEQAEIAEIIIGEDSTIIGQPLANVGFPQGIIIGAIVHKNVVTIPDGSAVINAGDRVIVFCLKSDAQALEQLFYRKKGGFLGELWYGHKDPR